jgi:hypothetical protein
MHQRPTATPAESTGITEFAKGRFPAVAAVTSLTGLYRRDHRNSSKPDRRGGEAHVPEFGFKTGPNLGPPTSPTKSIFTDTSAWSSPIR